MNLHMADERTLQCWPVGQVDRGQLGLSVTAWERRWLEAGLAPARAEQPKALALPQLRFEEAVQYAFGRNGFEASRS